MTAANKPTLDEMTNVAAAIAKDARENLGGINVVSVGPVFAELGRPFANPGGVRPFGSAVSAAHPLTSTSSARPRPGFPG
jgi:hypothetical protein